MLRARPIDGPFALTQRQSNTERIYCLNEVAARQGLQKGIGLGEARVLCPGLQTAEATPRADARFMRVLARWAGQYCPWVGLEEEGLALDVTGAAHLRGGEMPLLADMAERLARAGISHRAGLADTRGAAWAIARHGGALATPPSAGAAKTVIHPAPHISGKSTDAAAKNGNATSFQHTVNGKTDDFLTGMHHASIGTATAPTAIPTERSEAVAPQREGPPAAPRTLVTATGDAAGAKPQAGHPPAALSGSNKAPATAQSGAKRHPQAMPATLFQAETGPSGSPKANQRTSISSARRFRRNPTSTENPPQNLSLATDTPSHHKPASSAGRSNIAPERGNANIAQKANYPDTPPKEQGFAAAKARQSAVPNKRITPSLKNGGPASQGERGTTLLQPTDRASRPPEAAPFIIIPQGEAQCFLAPLPVAALRLPAPTCLRLQRLGIRTVGDLTTLPRPSLTRRFGAEVLLRLDQAFGALPEPVSPLPPPAPFAFRMTLPEPIGLLKDVSAGLERLLTQLCARLEATGKGARRLIFTARRVDQASVQVEVRLARAMREAPRIARLFERGLDGLDSGYGIDQIRLEAVELETLPLRQASSYKAAGPDDALADIITKLGNRIGLENITRLLPADSHLPEKSFSVAPAAYSEAANGWTSPALRPLIIFAPEAIAGHSPELPRRFCWRRLWFRVAHIIGPERIAPEWWFDHPDWRSGVRDYWRVLTFEGRRLWLFFTPQNPGWFVAGEFA